MTAAARLVAVAGLLLRATADALDAFARSLMAQATRVPDVIPTWLDEEVDLP